MKRLEDKVALVTGGCGALGRAICQRLTDEGARVVAGDVKSNPSVPEAVLLDVTSEASWTAALEQVLTRHGQLDILVNNAGITSPAPLDFEEVTLDEWRELFSVNAEGVFIGTREAIKIMKTRSGPGFIVNIGSIAGYYGVNKASAYGASKATVRSITKQAAISVARLGYDIRINSVHPSYVWTPLVKGRLAREYGSEQAGLDAVRKMNPLGRLVEPHDVAAAVAFLSSNDARMIHGADLVIDCGRLIQ
ncbi:MAG: SDR family oxidoreductase [Burkholderiales bacterium]|nr:SDR family oxidoreductase [Burkholderiales bacterium]